MECKFHECCKYYSESLGICRDEEDAVSGCAARWQFDEFDKGNQDIGINIANKLIIRISNTSEKISFMDNRIVHTPAYSANFKLKTV